MSLQACANLVARADPGRFAAAMAAPLAARAVLLPIYAASIEVARAPWVTQEPMIAEMRLQWWRDVFEEIEAGRPRKHEVVDALAPVLGPRGAAALDAMVLARRWDIYKEGFTTADDLLAHVQSITLGPMLAALEALGHLPEDLSAVQAHATQLGLARFLRGVPALIERKTPVWAEDQKVHIYRDLCIQALDMSGDIVPSPALIETAHCRRVLRFVRKNPGAVEIGAIPEFRIGAALARGWLAWRCG
ncbi:MAG: squalene/phytoene synthase family protein [Planktomarina sp.]|jgi:15-cis-phytoene synthase|nr:squalene/phytoene synthase family protein [Planktomarina sp.]MDG1746081.1 squalene/phytoene synthase family protein [Planktomarina sp.]